MSVLLANGLASATCPDQPRKLSEQSKIRSRDMIWFHTASDMISVLLQVDSTRILRVSINAWQTNSCLGYQYDRGSCHMRRVSTNGTRGYKQINWIHKMALIQSQG